MYFFTTKRTVHHKAKKMPDEKTGNKTFYQMQCIQGDLFQGIKTSLNQDMIPVRPQLTSPSLLLLHFEKTRSDMKQTPVILVVFYSLFLTLTFMTIIIMCRPTSNDKETVGI